MTLLSFDGKHVKSIDRGFSDVFYPSGYSGQRNPAVVGGLTPNQVYAMVAQAFRCVTMRANEVSRVPRALLDESGEDVTEQYKDLMINDDMVYSFEASMCLSGAAYAVLDVNPYGLNMKPRWVISQSVTAQYSGHPRQLQYFYRSEELNPRIDPARMVWWWAKNFEREDAPGPGETQVALAASSSLYAIDAMLAAYFNGGAVKVTVFPVPPGTPDAEVTKFQNWLNRRLSGVRNAFKNIVMKAKELSPVAIGSDVKDTQASEISKDLRDEIATAHGIPPNIVSGEYKYATADSEYLGWIAGEIIPRCDRMFEVWTERYYKRFGLKLITQARKMEIMQTAQLVQLTAAQTATGGKPVMLISEAREYADLKKELSVDELTELGLPLPKPVMPARPVRVMPASAAVIDNPPSPALNIGKPVKVEYAKEDGPKPTRVMKAVDVSATIEALKAWRKAFLSGEMFDGPISGEVRELVASALKAANTPKDRRAVFERTIAEVKASAAETEPISDARYLADALLAAAEAVRLESAG